MAKRKKDKRTNNDLQNIHIKVPVPDFPHRLGRLKPRASTSRGSLAKVYNIFVIVIDLFYICCHNSSVIFIALHFRIIRPISRH
jgi:hypothetical protein